MFTIDCDGQYVCDCGNMPSRAGFDPVLPDGEDYPEDVDAQSAGVVHAGHWRCNGCDEVFIDPGSAHK